MHIGLVGGGYWGSKHLRVFAGIPEVERLTLIEVDIERQKTLQAAFPSINVASDLDDVLPELDGVVVATKPGSHAALGRKVLEAGKHLLMEKPLVTNVADAAELCTLADEKGLVLMSGHTFEFNPVVNDLKGRIAAGDLGTVRYIRSLRLNLGLYQSDVNVIWDLAPHDISITNFLLDETPARVTAWGHHSASADFEDVAMLRLEYERSGVEAYVHVSWLDPSKVREVTVVGSEKMAVYDDLRSEEPLRIFDRGVVHPSPSSFRAPLSYRYGDITAPFINAQEPLLMEDTHFVESIKHGGPSKSDGYSGLRVVAVIEAAGRSLIERRPVDLAEVMSDAGVTIDLNRQPTKVSS